MNKVPQFSLLESAGWRDYGDWNRYRPVFLFRYDDPGNDVCYDPDTYREKRENDPDQPDNGRIDIRIICFPGTLKLIGKKPRIFIYPQVA